MGCQPAIGCAKKTAENVFNMWPLGRASLITCIYMRMSTHPTPRHPGYQLIMDRHPEYQIWKQARTIDGVFWGYLKRCFGCWIAEKRFKSWTIDGASWRYLQRCSWSLSCWDNFKSNDAKWCILALFKKRLEVGTAEKNWKQARTIDCALWRYLKRCFGCW